MIFPVAPTLETSNAIFAAFRRFAFATI